MKSAAERLALESYAFVEYSIFENFPFCSESGGAICASSIGSCVLKNLLFGSCSASHGGAVAISNSLVFLSSSCFASCSARERDENGGNAFLTHSSSLTVNLMSSFRCAPDTTNCGDAVFEVRTTNVHATHTNFSSCNGIQGECSFGSIDTNASRVSYMNVVDCYENSMYLLPGSQLENSNFIKNKPYTLFMDGSKGKMKIINSFFFGNNNKLNDYLKDEQKLNVEYNNCFGDVSRNGVTPIEEIKTCPQTRIVYQKCQELCSVFMPRHTCKKYTVVVIEIINCSDKCQFKLCPSFSSSN